MKLNNKGFAISSIMYIILILAVILISVTLAILSSRKLILDKIKKETTDNIYGISYNSVINTLKHEAISYASSNNIEKENIKIGDFETSVSQELLEHHELSDKYLTLSKTNYSYDVYLGQTKKVTDISKPISNMLGIVDYKIEGNSYQQTYTGKNLFNKYAITNSNYSISGEMITLKVIALNSSTGTSVSLRELCPMLEAGKTYTISYTTDSKGYISIGSYNATGQWKSGTSRTITEEDLDEVVRMGGGDTSQERNITFSNIQIEEGTTATSYEPYVGGVAAPNPQYPQEIKSVGERTKNIADLSQAQIATTTKHVTFDYDNSTGTLEYTSAPTQYDYVMIYLQRDVGYEFELGKTYYYGADITVTGKQTSDRTYIAFGINYSGGSTPSFFVTENGEYRQEGEFTYTGQETIRLLIHANYGSIEPAQVKFENIYVSEKNEFEPYRDNYNIPITARGKNLLDISDIEVNSSTKKIDCNLTEKFVVSAQEIPTSITDANGVDRNIWRMSFTYLDGSMKYMRDDAFKGVAGTTNVFSASEENPVVSIEYRNTYIREGAYRNIQIEYGTKATSYEPYVEPVTTNIYLDEPLRKIDDSKDSIYYLDQITSRKIGKVIYNGSESWGLYNTGNGYMTSNILFIDGEPIMSNRFINSQINTTKLSMRKNYKSLYAYGTQTFHTTADDWEAFLTNNNMEVIGKLVSPSNGTTITLPNIQTNIGSSMIEIDTSIKPSSVEFTVIEKIRKL